MIETALQKAGWINNVLVFAIFILIITAVIRLCGKQSIRLSNLEIHISTIQFIMIPLTIAHGFAGGAFNLWVRKAIVEDPVQAKAAFNALSEHGPLFFSGIVSRLSMIDTPVGPIFEMSWNDPTTWLAHLFAIIAFIVLVPWNGVSLKRRFGSIIYSACIIMVNWLIGGGWAVHASCLSKPEFCKSIFMLT